jgi:hypothetical protein
LTLVEQSTTVFVFQLFFDDNGSIPELDVRIKLSNISIAQNDAAVGATLLENLVGAMYPNIVASLTPPYIHEIGIVHGEGPDTVSGSEVLFSDGLGEEVYTFGSFSVATNPFVP